MNPVLHHSCMVSLTKHTSTKQQRYHDHFSLALWGEKKVSFESPVQLSDLCDIDDEGSYSGWWPTPSLW